MGDGHRSTARDLAQKNRNYAAAAAEDIFGTVTFSASVLVAGLRSRGVLAGSTLSRIGSICVVGTVIWHHLSQQIRYAERSDLRQHHLRQRNRGKVDRWSEVGRQRYSQEQYFLL